MAVESCWNEKICLWVFLIFWLAFWVTMTSVLPSLNGYGILWDGILRCWTDLWITTLSHFYRQIFVIVDSQVSLFLHINPKGCIRLKDGTYQLIFTKCRLWATWSCLWICWICFVVKKCPSCKISKDSSRFHLWISVYLLQSETSNFYVVSHPTLFLKAKNSICLF